MSDDAFDESILSRSRLTLDEIARGHEGLRESLLRRAAWLQARTSTEKQELWQLLPPKPPNAPWLIRKLLDDGADLVGAIEQVLTFLGDLRSRGERLPADCVDLAVTLIRMYSEPHPTDLPAWLERERARRLAGRFARDRVLGSHFGPSKKSRRLPPPKPEPEPAPASLSVSLFDLVKTFEQVLDKITKQSGSTVQRDPL